MSKIFAVFVCIFAFGLTLFFHIDKNNEMTYLRLAIPEQERDVKQIKLENEKLKFEIEQFESPIHLLELSKKSEYSHLKFPRTTEVAIIPKNGG